MSAENQQPLVPGGEVRGRTIDLDPAQAAALSSPAFWGEDAPDFATLAAQDPAAAYGRVREVKKPGTEPETLDKFLPPAETIVEPEQIVVTMTRKPGFFASIRGAKPTTETVSRFTLNQPKGDTQE